MSKSNQPHDGKAEVDPFAKADTDQQYTIAPVPAVPLPGSAAAAEMTVVPLPAHGAPAVPVPVMSLPPVVRTAPSDPFDFIAPPRMKGAQAAAGQPPPLAAAPRVAAAADDHTVVPLVPPVALAAPTAAPPALKTSPPLVTPAQIWQHTVTTAPAAPSAAAGVASSPAPPSAAAPPARPPASAGAPGTGSGVSGGREYTQPQYQQQQVGPGTRIHHYEVIKMIGRGGMGSVFLGRDTRLGRRVAIKFLHSNSADLTKRFILEARTTAACSHENIVVIYEVDAWQGAPFMVFEYLQGQTLTKLMPDDKPVPPPRAVELMVPVVRALATAHSQGIVHRDLKPDNIMVTDAGVTKVLDFGIAKVLQGDEKAPEYVARPRAPKTSLEDSDDSDLTQKGAMMGTVAYMAPEQWGIGVPIDHRADIWAVGIMLFKMLAGKHPLDPLRGPQLMVTGQLKEPMPTLRSKAPDVPEALARVVDRCLMKHAQQRWPDALTLLRELEPFLPGRYSRDLKIDESPYAGLSAFQESDADRFFGRQLEVAALVNRLRERPLIGVVGTSGAGKSSFVRAGLVPALKRSGEPWEAMVLRPGRDPLAALASLVSPLVSTSASVVDDLNEQKKLALRLASEPGFVGMVLRARARREKRNILLFVDQFEELYTQVADAAERKAFTASLAAVADDPTSPIRLVISIRSDFLDRVPEDPRFMAELSQGLVFLSSPGVEGLREAIVQPAEMAGYRFEYPDMVDEMIAHLASTQGALPLLQFSAQKLWEARDPARKLLTRKAYDAIGGVAGALASHADAVLAKLPPQSMPLVRAVLLRLVTPERTRAIVSLDELRELQKNPVELQSLIDELVQARLLVVQTGGGVATVEIVHESLIHSWPTLKRWLEESGEDASFLEQLRTASRQWQLKGRDANLLWRGELADEAQRFIRRYRGELTETQQRFLDAVIDQGARETRRKRTLAVAAVGFLTVLLAASVVALVVVQGARSEAQAQAIAAQRAEMEAKVNLETAQRNEQERAKAQAQAEAAAGELAHKRDEAMALFKKAEEARQEAELAEARATKNAKDATDARRRSDAAKAAEASARREFENLFQKEQKRSRQLEEQLGGPVIETLK